jgi:hypothetical protein
MSNSSAPQGPPPGPGDMPMGPPVIPFSEHAAHLGRVFYGVTVPLAVLATTAFFLRVYQRTRPTWKVGWDDWFILVGFVCLSACLAKCPLTGRKLLVLVDWFLIIPATPTTARIYPAEQATELVKYTIIAIPIWGLAMTCIKASICLTLLRIQQQTWWRIFMYTIIAIQTFYGVGNAIFVWFQCRPIEFMWNPFLPGGHCLPTETIRAVSTTGAAINITTDVLLSVAPATFLRKLNRPLRERVVLCVLMGMGLLASAASIVKTVITMQWNDPMGDTWAIGIQISGWTVIEEFLALLAACMPALRPVLHFVALHAFGVSLTRPKASSYNPQGTGASGSSTLNKKRSMKNLRTGTETTITAESPDWEVPKTHSFMLRSEMSKEDWNYPGRAV